MSCFILGDCLAVGLAAVLGGCQSDARVGAAAAEIISMAPIANYDLGIISAGTNDFFEPRLSHLAHNLEMVRDRVHATRVVWVRPVNTTVSRKVEWIAREHGDAVVHVTPGHGSRQARVHPKSYRDLAAAVLKAGAS